MKILNEKEIQQISGGFGFGGGFGGFNNFTFHHSSPELDKAVSRFSDAYSDYSKRRETSGFGEGALIGGAVGNAIGSFGGKLGGAVGTIVGGYAGKMYDDRFPINEYFDVKREAEKIYGLQ